MMTPVPTWLLATATLILCGFTVGLSGFVLRGGLADWDRRGFGHIRGTGTEPHANRWFTITHDLSAIGGDTARLLALAAAALLLILSGRPWQALLLVSAILSARLALIVIKMRWPRPRPQADLHRVQTYTSSFPSGHTMLTLIQWLGLSLLVAPSGAMLVVCVMLSLFLAAVVGLARIRLGVHWPSDVLVGWWAGLTWVMLWALAVRASATV